MVVTLHSFPTLTDGVKAIETKYCELLNQYRSGEKLELEALDWMDSANNWLMSTGSKL